MGQGNKMSEQWLVLTGFGVAIVGVVVAVVLWMIRRRD